MWNVLKQSQLSAGIRGDTSPRAAFTLIELLMVVALIALLSGGLLSSLTRATAAARMVQCQSNVRQLALTFCAYTTGNHGRLPGMTFDAEADWLGAPNVRPPRAGRMPEDGTIWRHMANAKWAYICPDDVREKRDFSYSSHLLPAGARSEWLAGAHHPVDQLVKRIIGPAQRGV